jgi:hypothetical protein
MSRLSGFVLIVSTLLLTAACAYEYAVIEHLNFIIHLLSAAPTSN